MHAFYPNCTLPPEGTNYVAAPNVRTTLDILWTSLATIVACTYSVLHLNVPEQRRGRDPGWKGDLKWSLRRFSEKLMWCIITILAPELTLGGSIGSYVDARRHLRILHQNCPHTKKDVTLAHMFLANMDGLVVRFPSLPERDVVGTESDILTSARENKDLFRPKEPDDVVGYDRTYLLARDLSEMSAKGELALELPAYDEIIDKSKSDNFARTLILLQIIYYVITVLVRVGYAMPIAELELGTVAFVACSTATYIMTIKKPKSVGTTLVLQILQPSAIEEVARGQRARRGNMETLFEYDDGGTRIVEMAVVLGSVLFGAIHLAGWNLSFPGVVDEWVWRASATVTTVAPVTVWLATSVGIKMADRKAHRCFSCLETFVIYASVVLYILGRLAIMVEMFRGLGYLPPAAFEATWTANVPHIG